MSDNGEVVVGEAPERAGTHEESTREEIEEEQSEAAAEDAATPTVEKKEIAFVDGSVEVVDRATIETAEHTTESSSSQEAESIYTESVQTASEDANVEPSEADSEDLSRTETRRPVPPSIRTEPVEDGRKSLASQRSSVSAARPPPTPAPMGSMVFVVTALENIANSKDARRKKSLQDSVQSTLAAIKKGAHVDPEDIFEPLRLATETGSTPLTTTALDCISKLITYSYFSMPAPHQPNVDPDKQPPPLIERAIDTICDCFQDEATTNEVQLQIVKSLLAAVLNDKFIVHGAGLLKAIRQVYNIFLLSKSTANQQVAQGTLTQMVGTVFERVQIRLALKQARFYPEKSAGGENGQSDDNQTEFDSVSARQSTDHGDGIDDGSDTESIQQRDRSSSRARQNLTLKDFENAKTFDDNRIGDNAPTMVTRTRSQKGNRSISGQSTATEDRASYDEDEEDEVFIKDAFLVFRSMCRLSMKQNTIEQLLDPKAQHLRSKLVALSIVRVLLNNYMEIFTSPLVTIVGSSTPTSFGQAINQYLRLVIGRNGPSSIKQVFETTCEIFWLVLKDMRVSMKREIEVFLKEIYLSILERRKAPNFQKLHFLRILRRLSDDPKAMVELYLNYDCDRTALDNMFQRIIELMSKLSSTTVTLNPQHQVAGLELSVKEMDLDVDWRDYGRIPAPLTTVAVGNAAVQDTDIPIEIMLKQGSLDCLIRALRSLRDWSQDMSSPSGVLPEEPENVAADQLRTSLDPTRSGTSPRPSAPDHSEGPSTPAAEDDPSQFEQAKARKTALTNDIRQFNFKPKRGLKQLLADGFIAEDTPKAIAAFIWENDQLDKAVIGEFLGEGDTYNIAIMHEFVDMMEFSKRRFVDALRALLQSFRLPGEAQKIDRFLLKFAERYVANNPNAYANADTAYVLAYSVIMLNVDQHSKKIKGNRMTLEDFIKNNRGINDGSDLPPEYLTQIYEDVANNEIVLQAEQDHAAALGILQPGNKDTAHQADLEMSTKAEERLRALIRAQRKAASGGAGRYISATSSRHVGPMFDATWMSFLSGISAQMQTTQNIEIIRTCMEAIRLAIHISCVFDLDTPRDAFVAALSNATNLGNLREMMAKNLEALKMLLEVALHEGNLLKGGWSSILTCISQLDRFQLISGGVDEEYVPDVRKATAGPGQKLNTAGGRRMQAPQRRVRQQSTINPIAQSEIAQEARSSEMTRIVDRIFTSTEHLSGDAIVHFVRALCEVSWQEIQSSGGSDTPRMYSLQKLVEISYYNMKRVRFEWTIIWQVLGEHFNEVACQGNTNVVFFALDSLRQLSMRFMEIAELPNFQFQKDFLKPFKHVMINSTAVNVKDMVLRCLVQMIQARGDNIRSGWKTIFGVFGEAAKEPYEALVYTAFDHVQQIYESRFGVVITQGAFPDFIVCLTEFSKNLKFQKKALNAIETLKSTIPRMLRTPECPLSQSSNTVEKPVNGDKEGLAPVSRFASQQAQQDQFWFPVLFAFHDILMTGEDLEVRSQALNYLFDTLVKYGAGFPPEFWDVLWRQLLYPIFMVLKSKSEMQKAPNHEDLSVWLSTTMIQALRNMISLLTHYFSSLEYMLDRFLDLLALCICQENDTIARIGSNCLQTLILQNVTKFNADHWHQIVSAFVKLFDRTTAHQLFTAATTISSPQIGDEDDVGSLTQPEETGLALSAEGTSLGQSEKVEGNGDINGTAEEMLSPRSSGPPPPVPAKDNVNEKGLPLEDYRPQLAQQQPVVVTAARRRFFNRIITRCVLQLLMIETVNELFSNSEVYAQIPSPELLRLMALLKKSYGFAKKFNNDKELRMRLWQEGFMRQPPNLLKQESGSAATYVSILVRMYFDDGEERRRNRAETEEALIPLCADIISSYVALDEETQQRNIVAWKPVVVDVMEAYTNFPAIDFEKHVETFYPLGVELLSRDMDREMRLALQSLLKRVGEMRMGMPAMVQTPLATPTSPRSIFGRRLSRVPSR